MRILHDYSGLQLPIESPYSQYIANYSVTFVTYHLMQHHHSVLTFRLQYSQLTSIHDAHSCHSFTSRHVTSRHVSSCTWVICPEGKEKCDCNYIMQRFNLQNIESDTIVDPCDLCLTHATHGPKTAWVK